MKVEIRSEPEAKVEPPSEPTPEPEAKVEPPSEPTEEPEGLRVAA